MFKVDKSKSIGICAAASFAGDRDRSWSEESSAFSRTGFLIYHAECAVAWISKLQTEISLSATESEHIALSHLIREAISMMTLFDEIEKAVPIEVETPKAHYTVFEDNNLCVELVKHPK